MIVTLPHCMTSRADKVSISVIIPAYNRAAVIERAVASVREQVVPAGWSVDVTIVDDGSLDVLAVNGVRVVRHDYNRGAAAARNTGIANATGTFVAFLDSDDVWLPGKLQAQIGIMLANDWVASCTAYVLAKRGRAIRSPRYPTGTLGLDDLVWGCFVSPGSTLICRRTVFEEVGPMDTTLPRLEDWDWLLRYGSRHPLGFLAEPLARIEPSMGGRIDTEAPVLDILRARYMPAMSGRHRRYFAAALAAERAAACHRAGDIGGAVTATLSSLLRSPFRNDALRAVLHNRVIGV